MGQGGLVVLPNPFAMICMIYGNACLCDRTMGKSPLSGLCAGRTDAVWRDGLGDHCLLGEWCIYWTETIQNEKPDPLLQIGE